MTYRDLLEQLSELSYEQLNQIVTVQVSHDEYVPVYETGIAVDDDVLDEDHFVLSIA
tara:strand:+ start:68 stop:238 length:171 start_codon:yes stop_codon:yes gene_type:complete